MALPSAVPVFGNATAAPPPGMEVKNVGGINVIVPQGTRVHKEGSQIVYEDLGEYLGRRFYELTERLETLRGEQEKQSALLSQLQQEIEKIRERDAR